MRLMRLSIDLFAPSDLPSLEKVREIFRYAVEMGLDGNKFDHIHVHFAEERKIVFDALYKDTYITDPTCFLTIVIEVKKGKPYGWFWIWDSVQKSNIAHSKLLPYKEFVPLVKKAQDIGTLHRDIRARWYEWKGWEDLLPYVKHVGN